MELWILVGIAAALLVWVVLTWNAFVRLRHRAQEAMSGVEVHLRRRHDLVPNLVRTVQAYATHEREALEEVVEARGAAAGAQAVGERQAKETGLTASLTRLLVLVERYPDLKADASFRRLQQDLVEVEDQIQYARRYYNGTVRNYNVRTEQFPSSVIAALFGLGRLPYFELESAAERVVPVTSFGEPPPA